MDVILGASARVADYHRPRMTGSSTEGPRPVSVTGGALASSEVKAQAAGDGDGEMANAVAYLLPLEAEATPSSPSSEGSASGGKASGAVKPVGQCSGGSYDGGVSKMEGTREDSSPSLSEWLKKGPYVLSMAPSFFGFYAYTGALMALEDAHLLDGVCYATGASAGSLATGLLAAGVSPRDMGAFISTVKRSDFWDPPGIGGILKGQKFEGLIDKLLPTGVRDMEDCPVPLAVSVFDLLSFRTKIISKGKISTALRASSTFPVMFSPVWHPQGVLVDGGVSDHNGMWCVPTDREDCRRVLNVSIGRKSDWWTCLPPSRAPGPVDPKDRPQLEVVSLVLDGVPRPSPFAMERGAQTVKVAQNQVAAVLDQPLQAGREKLHWIAPTETWTEVGPAASSTGVKAYEASVVCQPRCLGQDAQPVEAVTAAVTVNGKEIRRQASPGAERPDAFQRRRPVEEPAVWCSADVRRLDSDGAAVAGENSGSGAVSAALEADGQPGQTATAVGDDVRRGCVLSDGAVLGAERGTESHRLSANQASTTGRARDAVEPGTVGNCASVAAGEESEKGSKRGCSEANEPSEAKRHKGSLPTSAALRRTRDSISMGDRSSDLATGVGGASPGEPPSGVGRRDLPKRRRVDEAAALSSHDGVDAHRKGGEASAVPEVDARFCRAVAPAGGDAAHPHRVREGRVD